MERRLKILFYAVITGMMVYWLISQLMLSQMARQTNKACGQPSSSEPSEHEYVIEKLIYINW
jgi:hypothetical protein